MGLTPGTGSMRDAVYRGALRAEQMARCSAA
jgi:hypothetical protein